MEKREDLNCKNVSKIEQCKDPNDIKNSTSSTNIQQCKDTNEIKQCTSSTNIQQCVLGASGWPLSYSVGGEMEFKNFINDIVCQDMESKKFDFISTRFPPEPNGCLHLGHAKSIHLNFGLPRIHPSKPPAPPSRCNLRFDDTNPVTEKELYIEAIKADVRWLGGDWSGDVKYASDYFDILHGYALILIEKHLAYVDDSSPDEIRAARGSLTQPGTDSPFRNRSVSENLRLFEKMRAGDFQPGSCVLRAKIDMADGNMNMRDPIIYRILNKPHPRTGNKWKIYPTYDFAHGQCDSIEGISHSLCTVEFELHRRLYDWFQTEIGIHKTRQIEFSRLNLSHTVMSKRKLLLLVEEGLVASWDDPRMPTISGLRRRGVPPSAIHEFCDKVGISKRENLMDIALFEQCIRSHLQVQAVRYVGILRPLRVEVTNFDEEQLALATAGTLEHEFARYFYVDEHDFMEKPDPNFFRITLNRPIRLKLGYWITCREAVKNSIGEVVLLRCEVDYATGHKETPAGALKKGPKLQWLPVNLSCGAEFRLYDRLFTEKEPENEVVIDDTMYLHNTVKNVPINDTVKNIPINDTNKRTRTWRDCLNPHSLIIYYGYVRREATQHAIGDPLQFEGVGFFTAEDKSYHCSSVEPLSSASDIANNHCDLKSHFHTLNRSHRNVFNLTISLNDAYASSKIDSDTAKNKEAKKIAMEQAAARRQAVKDARAARNKNN